MTPKEELKRSLSQSVSPLTLTMKALKLHVIQMMRTSNFLLKFLKLLKLILKLFPLIIR
ncbi:hypothetical protein Hanom_Chr11g01028881 [Helianthus anomalus]